MAKFDKLLGARFEVKVRGRLGNEKGDDADVRILNRIVRTTQQGIG